MVSSLKQGVFKQRFN